eukprot:360572-Chlamydomonas_euryale.AAC.9
MEAVPTAQHPQHVATQVVVTATTCMVIALTDGMERWCGEVHPQHGPAQADLGVFEKRTLRSGVRRAGVWAFRRRQRYKESVTLVTLVTPGSWCMALVATGRERIRARAGGCATSRRQCSANSQFTYGVKMTGVAAKSGLLTGGSRPPVKSPVIQSF